MKWLFVSICSLFALTLVGAAVAQMPTCNNKEPNFDVHCVPSSSCSPAAPVPADPGDPNADPPRPPSPAIPCNGVMVTPGPKIIKCVGGPPGSHCVSYGNILCAERHICIAVSQGTETVCGQGAHQGFVWSPITQGHAINCVLPE